MVRTSRYKYLELVHGCLCGILPAGSAEMRWTYVMHHANNVYSDGSETGMTQRFWNRMMIRTNGILAAKADGVDFMYSCSAPNDC